MEITTSPLAVLATFQRVTGIKIRVISHDMEAQALDFVKHGFAISDLEKVLRWTQSQIGSKAGFSTLSLQWRVIFGRRGAGDEWQTFQERLSLAEKTVRTRPEPKAVTRHVRVDEGKVISMLDVAPEPDTTQASQLVAAQLARLRKEMTA